MTKHARFNVGEGMIDYVYRGAIQAAGDSCWSVDIAIKRLCRKGVKATVLGVVDHHNSVKLIRYCTKHDECGMQLLLVYEFML